MQKFADDISILDEDNNLVPLASASVTVYHAGTTTVASIFSDDGVTPADNPLTAGEDGSFEFYAANGKYDVLVEKSPYKPHHENGILLDDSSVVVSGSLSSVISADNSLATRMSVADSVVLSSSTSAETSIVTRLSTVDSSLDSVSDSADTSVITQLSIVDSTVLSTSLSAADSASGAGGVSQSYVDSTDTSVVSRLSTADSENLSSSYSADTSVLSATSTDDSTVLSTAVSAADSAATLAGSGAVDNIVRDDVVMLAWQLQIETGLGSVGLEDGVVDEFEDETGVDTTASTNESYNSADDYYSPSAGAVVDNMEYASDALAQAAYVTNATYTSDIIGGGTISADTTYSGYPAGNAIDDNGTTLWVSDAGVAFPHWIKYDFGSGVTKIVQRITIRGDSSRLKDFQFQGSNNDSDWTTIYTGVHANDTTVQTFSFPNSTGYRYYRIYGTTGWGAEVYMQVNEWEMMELPLQSYSESTIKTQGSYSLKAVATTDALNKTLTRTIGSPIDLSGIDTLYFKLRSSRTGGNIKVGIHDSGGTTTEKTHSVSSANTWETCTWDISGVADADKDAIDSIIITIVNADAANTFYIDNFVGPIGNMTLVSEAVEAESEPTTARFLALVEEIDSITINTDLIGSISNDDGANFDAVTLAKVAEVSGKDLYAGDVNLTDRDDKTMVQKLVTANNKSLRVHAWGMLWR